MVEDEGQGLTLSEHTHAGLLDNDFAAKWHALLAAAHKHTSRTESIEIDTFTEKYFALSR